MLVQSTNGVQMQKFGFARVSKISLHLIDEGMIQWQHRQSILQLKQQVPKKDCQKHSSSVVRPIISIRQSLGREMFQVTPFVIR